jgi:hypothetical protein
VVTSTALNVPSFDPNPPATVSVPPRFSRRTPFFVRSPTASAVEPTTPLCAQT